VSIVQITPQFRPEDQHTAQRVTLDGIVVRLDSYTNTFDGSWNLDIYDADDAPIVMGIGVTVGLDLFYPYRHLGLPPGVLFVQDQTGTPAQDPGLDSFEGDRFALFYMEAGTV
jgi:hypothetical protein